MTMQRKFQGVWIPDYLWLDRSLSLVEKVMLVEIGSLQDEERGCYATNGHFAEFFGLSISRVSEIISGLAEKGYLRVEQIREGKRIVERRVYLTDPFGKPNTPSENAANPFGKGDEPPSEKAKGNNTRENNTGSKPNSSEDDGFETAWKAYPKREGSNPKNKAHSAWNARLKEGVTAERMLAGVARYAAFCKVKGNIGTSYVMQAVRFFGTAKEFDNEWTVAAVPNSRPSAITQDFQSKRYEGTPDEQFADFLR